MVVGVVPRRRGVGCRLFFSMLSSSFVSPFRQHFWRREKMGFDSLFLINSFLFVSSLLNREICPTFIFVMFNLDEETFLMFIELNVLTHHSTMDVPEAA